MNPIRLTIETELEADGRWIGEVPELPGASAYGATELEAAAKAEALALRILADRLGWSIKPQSGSHRVWQRPGRPDFVFAFHNGEEIGPKMISRIAKHTGLDPESI